MNFSIVFSPIQQAWWIICRLKNRILQIIGTSVTGQLSPAVKLKPYCLIGKLKMTEKEEQSYSYHDSNVEFDPALQLRARIDAKEA